MITLLTKLLETQQLIELPIYIRHSVTYAALILFKLYLTPLLLDKYVDSARQSIVTVHRLFRNQLTAWATSVENDISRTASVLEKLNFVLVTHPEVFIEEEGIVSRMRSHLTGTLFYDLVWCVHEARRRQMDPNYDAESAKRNKEKGLKNKRKLYPLPFYNQISKEDFETITQTTPGGTTVTTLVPTKNAIKQAKQLAKSQGDVKGPITHINGIPISMLDETGSVNIEGLLAGADISLATDNVSRLLPTSVKNDVGLALSETNEITSAKASDVFTNNRQTSPIPLSSAMSRKSSVNTTTNPHKKTSASILSGDPNSLFSMNNSLQANIQLNKTLSADSTTTVAPTTTANDNPNTGVNTLGRSPTNSYSNLNMFYNSNNGVTNVGTNLYPSVVAPAQTIPAGLPSDNPQPLPTQPPANANSELDDFFLRQSAGWIEGNSSNDDFLGWFDINMAPEF